MACHQHKIADARAQARERLDGLRLSPKERAWVEQQGEELISLLLRGLSERLEAGVSFNAIPAVFAYAQAVVETIYGNKT